LAAFAQFGSDLDKATQARLARGERLVEVLKQGQYKPMTVQDQVMILFTAVNGYLDDLPVERAGKFEEDFLKFMASSKPEIGKEIVEKGTMSDELIDKLKSAIGEFKKMFV
jgi:F-type H+-transporting ATPase subunit alpha